MTEKEINALTSAYVGQLEKQTNALQGQAAALEAQFDLLLRLKAMGLSVAAQLQQLDQDCLEVVNSARSLQDTVSSLGGPAAAAKSAPQSGPDIASTVAEIEMERERLRNQRIMAGTSFENASQKATQLMNMLSQIMRTANEMRQGVVRNMR